MSNPLHTHRANISLNPSGTTPIPTVQPLIRDVFLSHAGADKDFTRRLAMDIVSRESNGNRLTVWIDEGEIGVGDSITRLVNVGLEQSRFIVIVMTPAYFQSNSGWTDAEWHACLHVDPDNRKGRILPILAEDCPYVPVLLRHLLHADLRHTHYSKGLDQLLAPLVGLQPRLISHRGQLIRPSGLIDRATLVAERSAPTADPEFLEEDLSCNLLPVDILPPTISIARLKPQIRGNATAQVPTKTKLKEIIRHSQLREGVEPIIPAFRIIGDRIITFHDAESPDSLFAPVIRPDDSQAEDIHTFIQDEDNRKIVISLFNMSLQRRLFARGLTIDRSKRGSVRFFYAASEGIPRVVNWKPFQKSASRTVAKPYRVGETTRYWLHQAAHIHFLILANKFYVQIIPTWLLTTDGSTVLGGAEVGRILVRWTGSERNASILYHVKFWTTLLRNGRGPITLHVGDQAMQISHIPAHIHQIHGIPHDQRNLMASLDREALLIAQDEDAIDIQEIASEESTDDSQQSEQSNEDRKD